MTPVHAEEDRWEVLNSQEEKNHLLERSESNKRSRGLVFVKFYGDSV